MPKPAKSVGADSSGRLVGAGELMKRSSRFRGQLMYLYRAVDGQGNTVEFFLSRTRGIAAAKAFFRKALKHHREPHSITLDGHRPSHSALRRMGMNGEFNFRGPNPVRIRCCQYLNNVVEQDHRRVKGRLRPMFKTFYQMRDASLSASNWRRRFTNCSTLLVLSLRQSYLHQNPRSQCCSRRPSRWQRPRTGPGNSSSSSYRLIPAPIQQAPTRNLLAYKFARFWALP